MALKIRLARAGAKKRPFYRIVVADSRSPRDGRFVERVGTYDPLLAADDPERLRLKEERIRHWLGRGARPSDRVARFLGAAEITPMPPRRNNPKKALPKKKAQARLQAEAEAKAAPPKATEPEAAPADAAAETETPPAAETEAPEATEPEAAPAEAAAEPEATAAAAPDEAAPAEDSPPGESAEGATESASAEAEASGGESEPEKPKSGEPEG